MNARATDGGYLRPTASGRYVVKTFRLALADAPTNPDNLPLANDPMLATAAARAAFALLEPDQEHTIMFALNARNRIIGYRHCYSGTIDRAVVEPRGILRDAILLGAVGIILSHNHPSGDPAPSREDREFTRRLSTACEAIGIRLLDHIVVGTVSHVSFRESGLL